MSLAPPLPEVILDHGLHVLGTSLWLDPDRAREMAFISRAGLPGLRRHRKLLCTDVVARLAGEGKRRLNALVAPYGRPFFLGPHRIALLPSGAALGAALLRVEGPGWTLLYARDPRLLAGRHGPPAEPPRADLLILALTAPAPPAPAPAARPHTPPPATEAATFARDTLAADATATAVILCEPVGDGQELLAALAAHDLPLTAHPAIADASALYAERGISLPPVRRAGGRLRGGDVVLWPWRHWASPRLRALPRARTLAVGVPPGAVLADAELHSPWGPSREELVRFVQQVRPRRVDVSGDPALAKALGAAGLPARDLQAGPQLTLAV